MDEEKLIHVNFQIPPSALDSLSRLAEQLRMLTEAAAQQAGSASGAAEREHGESGSFDPERFHALRQGIHAQANTAAASVSDAADARSVSSDVQMELQNARGAGEVLSHGPEYAVETDASSGRQRDPSDERDTPSPPAEAVKPGQTGMIPSVRAEAEEIVPDAPEARREAEQQIPDVESARAEAETRDLVLAAVQGEVSGGIEAPLGAGVVVQAQPELPQSRWSGVTEELVVPGPAPLTAEAVSLAFERDGRRYDNGFPLY